jgi:hypothetical protein
VWSVERLGWVIGGGRMWVVVMLVIASLVGAGVYWVSLVTLPEDHVLEERADRWRERLDDLGLRPDRLRPLLDRLRSRLRDLGSRVDDLGSRVEDLTRRWGSRNERPEPILDAPTSPEDGPAGAAPILPAAAVAVETAHVTSSSALEAPPVEPPWRLRRPRWSWPGARGDGAVTTPDDAPTGDVADADGVLYVPVVVDQPDAHSRLFGLLGIVVLVMVAGGILALGVWQSIHLIARILDNVAGA